MNMEQFEKLVDKALEEIPEELLELLENVTIVVENFPTRLQLHKIFKDRGRGMLLGLYEGVPQTKRGRYGYGGQIPDKITIFRIPILSLARSEEHLKQVVKNTVEHEIAHHFGMDEKLVRKYR